MLITMFGERTQGGKVAMMLGVYDDCRGSSR
eukprot:SAG31_NODE_279_length_18600_cov_21.254527_3_plen_31_part_00